MKLIDISTPTHPDAWTKVDDEDYEYLNQWKWFKSPCGYAVRNSKTINKKRTCIYMHCFILGKKKGLDIDHINHNKLDNQRSNLRRCSRSKNRANSEKRFGFSKHKGVRYDHRYNSWVARICKNYNRKYIGTFKSEEDAAIAYNKEAIKLFGEYASLNRI
jgi:hypothetical protein